jgi:4-hydroxy-tetrahydrodipicolinate reductase
MKIALLGYGKMGCELEAVAKTKGIEIVARIDPANKEADYKEINSKSVKDADVCIDFTTPESAVENLKRLAELHKNVVMATTGWYDRLEEARKIVDDSDIGFIYSPNFSIGVNAFFRMVKRAAEVMNKLEDYDVFAYELHHSRKKDSPSGTARTIGNILIENIERKKKLVFEKLDRKIEPEELHVSSVRAGDIPGTHVVGFDSAADTIELKHTARSRKGFALGALMAALFIKDKKGFFTIDDMMKAIIGGE